MATAVFVHAHPDDEAIATSGVMMQGVENGHRVVLICATDGSMGETTAPHIADSTALAEIRLAELRAAAEIIGVNRLELLGYRDSGMAGDAANDDPSSFWQADVEAAACRVAKILREESADLVTIYDEIGGYGHPDHIQVHRVGKRAAELASMPVVFESTMNRELMQRSFDDLGDWQPDGFTADDPATLEEHRRSQEDRFGDIALGTPGAQITHAVDVTAWIDRKRAAMAAHASQIGEDSFLLHLSDESFENLFGTEWFVLRGADRTGEPYEADIYAGLNATARSVSGDSTASNDIATRQAPVAE